MLKKIVFTNEEKEKELDLKKTPAEYGLRHVLTDDVAVPPKPRPGLRGPHITRPIISKAVTRSWKEEGPHAPLPRTGERERLRSDRIRRQEKSIRRMDSAQKC
jgi:hypothetical protein